MIGMYASMIRKEIKDPNTNGMARNTAVVDASGFGKGMFVIKVNGPNGVQCKKLVKI